MEEQLKEAYFDEYCDICTHKNAKESEDPCCECLATFARPFSHVPLNFVKNKHTKSAKKYKKGT